MQAAADPSRQLLGKGGTGKGALPLPRWIIDRPENSPSTCGRSLTRPPSACFTYLRLLDFRDSYGLFDRLNSHGFDSRCDRLLFHLPRSVLRCPGFWLGRRRRRCSRLSYCPCLTTFSLV